MPTDSICGHARLRIVFALFLVFIATTSLAQPVQIEILDDTMIPQRGTLVSLNAQHIVFLDEHGEEKTLAWVDVVRLIQAAPIELDQRPFGAGYGTVILTDNQKFSGRWVGQGEDDGSLRWQVWRGPTIDIPLDDLLVITQGGSVMRHGESELGEDLVILSEGDEQLIGFVESIGEDGIGFLIGESNQPAQISTDRFRSIFLANPVKEIHHSQLLWRVQYISWQGILLQALRCDSDAITRDSQLLGHSILEQWEDLFAVKWESVAMIEPVGGRWSTLYLNKLPRRVIAGGEVFGVPISPDFSSTISFYPTIHAPVSVAFDLPDSAKRFVMTAALTFDEDVPADRRAWASCDLVILSGEEELFRETLDAEHEFHEINVELTGGDLVIRLESGANGPVLDRVELRDAEVLIDNER